jgi:ribosomal protein L37AE/L43A
MSKERIKRVTAAEAGAKPERLMGPHGPLRMFSTIRFNGSMFYESRDWNGYAGMYVCDQCLEPSPMGVMRVGEIWTCGGCRTQSKANRRSKQVPASAAVREQMRIAREARKRLAAGVPIASLDVG